MSNTNREQLLRGQRNVQEDIINDNILNDQQILDKQKTRTNQCTALVCIFVIISAVFIGLYATEKVKNGKNNNSNPDPSTTPISDYLSNYIKSHMDTTADPCNDFYSYVCGAYTTNNVPPFPQQNSSNILSFTNIAHVTDAQKLEVLNKNFEPVGKYYSGCNYAATGANQAYYNNALSTLIYWMQFIDSVKTIDDFWYVFGVLTGHGLGQSFLISIDSNPKYANNSYGIPSLPDNEYAALNNEFGLEFVAVTNDPVLSLGADKIEHFMQLLNNDTAIAGLNYNFFSQVNSSFFSFGVMGVSVGLSIFQGANDYTMFNDINSLNTIMNMNEFIRGLGNHSIAYLLAGQPCSDSDNCAGYADHLETLAVQNYKTLSFQTDYIMRELRNPTLPYNIQNSLKFHVILDFLQALDPKYYNFPGFNSPLIVAPNSCMANIENDFNNVFLHEWYIDELNPGTREAVTELVDIIYKQLGNSIINNTWLDQATRTRALNKWSLITKNIIYDSTWNNDLFGLIITGDFSKDLIAGHSYAVQRLLLQLDMPYDIHNPETDQTSPDDINAFYDPITNSINMIPGLMQFPAFDPTLPLQLNIASYGWVIGHGFDNDGRLYDGVGEYKNWWKQSSIDQFNNRAQCLVNQYNTFTYPLSNPNGPRVNGQQTLGENIADNGGIRLAWHSYQSLQQSLNDAGTAVNLMDGYTNDQLFWIWAASLWCGSSRPDIIAKQVGPVLPQPQRGGDVHSPFLFRVRGAISNAKGFAETWGCKASDYYGRSLNPNQGCLVW